MARRNALEAKQMVDQAAVQRSTVRLDPSVLPQRFKYRTGLGGEAGEAAVILDRAMATVCRRLPSGIPMAMRMPINVFEGVAVRMANTGGEVMIVVELLHRDPMLSLPLMVTLEMDDVVADWRAWGRALSLPLLMVNPDGSYQPVEDRIGAVAVGVTRPRRRRTVLAKRRPRFLLRRRPGNGELGTPVNDEREITSWE